MTVQGDYEKGLASQAILLWILFILVTFVIMLHLMNMLIAIMGMTFSNIQEYAEENRQRE